MEVVLAEVFDDSDRVDADAAEGSEGIGNGLIVGEAGIDDEDGGIDG